MVPNGCEYWIRCFGVDGGDSSFSTSPFGQDSEVPKEELSKKDVTDAGSPKGRSRFSKVVKVVRCPFNGSEIWIIIIHNLLTLRYSNLMSKCFW